MALREPISIASDFFLQETFVSFAKSIEHFLNV